MRPIIATIAIMLAARAYGDFSCESLNTKNKGDLLSKKEFIRGKSVAEVVNLPQWRGKTILVYFWVPWLPECIADMKNINNTIKTLIEKEEYDLEIIPIMLSGLAHNTEDAISRTANFHKAHKIDLSPIFVDMNDKLYTDVQEKNESRSLPLTILIDSKGREVGRLLEGSAGINLREIFACASHK